jgi:hypothetical protein
MDSMLAIAFQFQVFKARFSKSKHNFQANPEWILSSFTAETKFLVFASIDEQYSGIMWTLKIQRRPNYYVTVTMI